MLFLGFLPFVATAQSGSPNGKTKPGSGADATSAVANYVTRTWEVTSSDFSVKQRKDEDGLLVYRVTLRADKSIAPPLFRVLDVYVEPFSVSVVGERQVR